MNALNNIRMGPKLIASFLFVALIIIVVAVVSYVELGTLDENMTTMYSDRTIPLGQASTMGDALYRSRGNMYKLGMVPEEADAVRQAIADDLKLFKEQVALYKQSNLTAEEAMTVANLEQAWTEYEAAINEGIQFIQNGNSAAFKTSVSNGGHFSNAREGVDEHLQEIYKLNVTLAGQLNDEGNAIYANATNLLFGSAIAGVLLAIIFGVVLSNSITTPMQQGVKMMEEMSKGRLNMRLNFDRKDEIGVLARAMDTFAEDLQKNLVASLRRIADGDLSVDVQVKDAGDEISPALKQTTESLRGLVAEAHMLTRAAVEGRLSTRGDDSKFKGGYHDIVKGVNDTLDAVVGPLNVAAVYVDRISKGDIPDTITNNYNGDFNIIKNNLNRCIDALNGLIGEMNRMSSEHDKGDIDVQINANQFQGAYRIMATGINNMVFAHISAKKKAMACVGEFGKGNFEAPLERFPGKKVFINETIEQVRANLKALIADADMLAKAGVEGRLSTRADASKHQGDFRKIVQGVNDTLDAVIGPLNVAADYVDRISKGDIPAKITNNYNGDFNIIKHNLNTAIDAVNLLVADAEMLSKAGVEGRLATRADASRHQGDYRRIVQGVNDTLDAVIGPLNVAASYVDSMAKGDIPGKIADNYNGDFNILKNNLNRLSDSLRDMITKIGEATNNVNSAAAEILAATTQQASGASEQSAAVTETTTTVDEVKAISEQVVERAREVTESAKRTAEVSAAGQRAVQETIDSMYQIKEKVEGIAENILALSEKTQQIGEIISSVNDIASQSNMLALNASIEAARAGEHGKGFAVVAMEVRNLAEQSKAATAQVSSILSEIQNATNTTVMVTEEGTKGVDRGVRLAAQSQEAIEKLAETIRESNQAAMQVMAGGQQQATGIEQISLAMKNINQVTVQSMASTKQAEKAAQNLNDLSRKLSETLQAYRAN